MSLTELVGFMFLDLYLDLQPVVLSVTPPDICFPASFTSPELPVGVFTHSGLVTAKHTLLLLKPHKSAPSGSQPGGSCRNQSHSLSGLTCGSESAKSAQYHSA